MMTVLAKLVIRNEISTRRAAVRAYITSQLLRTLPEIEREDPPRIIFDVPRPKPGPEDEAERAAAEQAKAEREMERERILKDPNLTISDKLERLRRLA